MKKIFFGLLVIAVGVLLIAFNQGYISDDYKHIFLSWQMLLIAIGLINLGSRDGLVSGLILIGVGGFFLLPEFSEEYQNIVRQFWPILLIVLGIMIIFKKKRIPSKNHKWQKWDHQHNSDDAKFDDGIIDETNIFSGNKRNFSSGEFKGGRISNVFGGSEIDLTQATLAQGESYLDIECVFGGISLIVPSDWDVSIRVKTVMGGFVDKRRNVRSTDSSRKLIIRGKAIFGGGEIKN